MVVGFWKLLFLDFYFSIFLFLFFRWLVFFCFKKREEEMAGTMAEYGKSMYL